MTKKEKTEKERWTIEELVAMTDTVQSEDIEWNGKKLHVQWCELVEAEEPKMDIPDDDTPDDEVQEHYRKIAGERVLSMIAKANEKNPENITIYKENWALLPSTFRWAISGAVLGSQAESFTSG